MLVRYSGCFLPTHTHANGSQSAAITNVRIHPTRVSGDGAKNPAIAAIVKVVKAATPVRNEMMKNQAVLIRRIDTAAARPPARMPII